MSQTEKSNDRDLAGVEMISSTETLYDLWASTYDTVLNKTRDLEKIACIKILSKIQFKTAIEFGCGTGKTTVWLAAKAKRLIAVDLSAEMQDVAKTKVTGNVDFKLADITRTWNFASVKVDLITCSLILEHVEDLNFVFREAARHLEAGSHFYICELHPFKQYSGSKARFETDEGLKVLECFTLHISDFTNAGKANGLSLIDLTEWFDNDDQNAVPRLISFLFRKK